MKSRNTRETLSQEPVNTSSFEYREFPHVPTSVTLMKESYYKNSVSLLHRKHENKSAATVSSDKSSTFKTFGSISSRKAVKPGILKHIRLLHLKKRASVIPKIEDQS